MLQKTVVTIVATFYFLLFFNVRCVTKPNSQSGSELLHTKTELWDSQNQNASLYGAEAAPHFHCYNQLQSTELTELV